MKCVICEGKTKKEVFDAYEPEWDQSLCHKHKLELMNIIKKKSNKYLTEINKEQRTGEFIISFTIKKGILAIDFAPAKPYLTLSESLTLIEALNNTITQTLMGIKHANAVKENGENENKKRK